MKGFVLASLVFCASITAQPDPWQPVRFLIGSWEAKSTGKVETSGTYSFEPDLKNHVIVRRSPDPAGDHSDILYIYSEPGPSLKAIYFDNEGHVIHYNITAPSPTSVVFLSEASAPGPQFRLTYELKAGIMNGKFQVKAPDQSGFASYLEWSGHGR